MMKVRVVKTANYNAPNAPFAWQKIFAVWTLTSMIVPSAFIYGLIVYGSPALLIADERSVCVYLDVFGSFQTRNTECSWYAFRKIDIWRGL